MKPFQNFITIQNKQLHKQIVLVNVILFVNLGNKKGHDNNDKEHAPRPEKHTNTELDY